MYVVYIINDVKADVIAVPVVILFVKLKYGIDMDVVPLNVIPAIFLVIDNCKALSAIETVVGFQLTFISILFVVVFYLKIELY